MSEVLAEQVSVEQHINQELQRFDQIDAAIAKIQEEYRDLKINGPEDKDGYEIVKNAWRHTREIRLEAEKTHKEVTDEALKFKQAIDGKLRQIKDGLKPMEDNFHAQWKAEDSRKEREKEEARLEAERVIKDRNDGRKQALFSMGLNWNGQAYVHHLPSVRSVTEAEVIGLDDEPYIELLNEVCDAVKVAKEEAAKEEEKRIEAARIQKEQADKQAEIAAENARVSKDLADKQRAFDEQVNGARRNELVALGAIDVEMPMGPFSRYDAEQWTDEVRQVKAIVERRKEDEAKATKQAEVDRKANDERIRVDAANAERARAAKEVADRELAEKERILQAGDVGVLEAISATLNEVEQRIEQLELKSAIAKQGMNKASRHIGDAIAVIRGTLKDLN